MARLSKQVREWVDKIGISPSAIEEALIQLNDDIAFIVYDEADSELQKLKGNSHSRSMQSYFVRIDPAGTRKIQLGGETIEIPNKNVSVEAPGSHQAMDINVFDLIDAGTPERPFRQKPYVLWSWFGSTREQRNTSIPQGRSSSNLRQQLIGPSRTPIRPEPRSPNQFVNRPPQSFFSKGPLAAVPGKNLYTRIMSGIRRRLSRNGYPTEGVTFSGRKK